MHAQNYSFKPEVLSAVRRVAKKRDTAQAINAAIRFYLESHNAAVPLPALREVKQARKRYGKNFRPTRSLFEGAVNESELIGPIE